MPRPVPDEGSRLLDRFSDDVFDVMMRLRDRALDCLPHARTGSSIVGDPDDALEQCARWDSAGLDQLVFGIGPASKEDTLETIRLLGEHVIPKLDRDPVHSTTRYRDEAAG